MTGAGPPCVDSGPVGACLNVPAPYRVYTLVLPTCPPTAAGRYPHILGSYSYGDFRMRASSSIRSGKPLVLPTYIL